MKKIITITLCVLLAVGAVGGSFALFKHFDGGSKVEKPLDDSTDDSQQKPNEDDSGDEGNQTPNENPSEDNKTQTVKVWQLCTEDTEFNVGDQIVVAAQSHEYALGNVQNASNRAAVKILKNDDLMYINEQVQAITLEQGMTEGTFAFAVEGGYLYAASSSSNVLKTHASIDENSCWKITIDANNTALVQAQGASTKNVLMFNPASLLFSCYSSTQDAVVVYKAVEIEVEVNPPVLKEGEVLLTDISDFRVGQKYRFYLDKDHPESEAYIILNLVTEDGGFNGGFTEPGTTGEVDLPNIKIGISNAYDGPGYIYWGDKRLSVDAEVSGDGEYLEILLDENVFSATGDSETPEIWFELTQETECIWIGCYGGAYIVAVPDAA